MLQVILGLALVVGIVAVGMQLAVRWAGKQLTGDLVARLRAGETVVNDEQLPESWLAPYRARITGLRSSGKGESEIAAVGLAAHKHCLSELDKLIRFYEKTNLADSPDTKENLLLAMREQRARWAASSWQALLAANQTDQEQPGVSR
jgi:hypothetical protein